MLGLSTQFLLPDKAHAYQGPTNKKNRRTESSILSLLVTSNYNLPCMGFQLLDVVQTLPHSLHNLVGVFSTLQTRPQLRSESLLDNRSSHRNPNHAPERPKQIRARCSNCLILWVRICNDINERSSDYLVNLGVSTTSDK
jgi:hypothetical protein